MCSRSSSETGRLRPLTSMRITDLLAGGMDVRWSPDYSSAARLSMGGPGAAVRCRTPKAPPGARGPRVALLVQRAAFNQQAALPETVCVSGAPLPYLEAVNVIE